MTYRDGALVGGLTGIIVALGGDAFGMRVNGWGVVGLTAAGLVLGAAAAGARRPSDFKRALFLPASRQ